MFNQFCYLKTFPKNFPKFLRIYPKIHPKAFPKTSPKPPEHFPKTPKTFPKEYQKLFFWWGAAICSSTRILLWLSYVFMRFYYIFLLYEFLQVPMHFFIFLWFQTLVATQSISLVAEEYLHVHDFSLIFSGSVWTVQSLLRIFLDCFVGFFLEISPKHARQK